MAGGRLFRYCPRMEMMPSRLKVGLAAFGALAISLALGVYLLTFKPTPAEALVEVSGLLTGWERRPTRENASPEEYNLTFGIEGQVKKFSVWEPARVRGTDFAVIEREIAAGTTVTVRVDKENFAAEAPYASVYELRGPDKVYLTLEQAQQAQRDNVAIAKQIALVFGAGAFVMIAFFVFYDAVVRAAGGSASSGVGGTAALVARLAVGDPKTVGAADYAALLEAPFLMPTMEEYQGGGSPLKMPETQNAAGERFAYLFSGPESFKAWGQAPHSIELSGGDAFQLVLANGFAGVVIDASGPQKLGLTRSVLKSLTS